MTVNATLEFYDKSESRINITINGRVNAVWINPTNNSSPKKGNGAITGIKNAITVSKTSPAKIFPNNRKENEIIFENSEINSKIPT